MSTTSLSEDQGAGPTSSPPDYLTHWADHTSQVVILSTPDNRIEWVNKAFVAVTGIPFDEAVGRPPGDVLPIAPGSDVQPKIDAALAAGEPFSGEIPYQLDGQLRRFHVELQPIIEAGRIVRFVGFNRDISDTEQGAAESEHGHELQAIGSLEAGVAHELNTPVQYISDNVSFLEESFSELAGLCQAMVAAVTAPPGEDGLRPRLDESDIDSLVGEIPRALEQSSEGLRRVASIVRGMTEFAQAGEGHREADID